LGAEGRGFESLRPDQFTSSFSILFTEERRGDTKSDAHGLATDHDGDQASYLGNRAGEESLHGGESRIERRPREGNRRSDEEERECSDSARPTSIGMTERIEERLGSVLVVA
jgi:hypothetical protein